jgi:hypothetical protein
MDVGCGIQKGALACRRLSVVDRAGLARRRHLTLRRMRLSISAGAEDVGDQDRKQDNGEAAERDGCKCQESEQGRCEIGPRVHDKRLFAELFESVAVEKPQ